MTALKIHPLAPAVDRPNLFLTSEERNDAGLHFTVARSMQDVINAWQLLYTVYLRAGFVAPNPFELHTTPEAIGEGSLVVLTKIQDVTVGTISAISDGPNFLPLDTVYHPELNQLRNEGRTLIEVGLFGDRRDDGERSFTAVLELMRYTFWFGRYTGKSDFVCGIPPRRAKLYARAFGFDIIGEATSYASVQENPVVLLRSETEKAIANRARHKAIAYFLDHPLGPEVFEPRVQLTPQTVRGTILEQYLACKNAQHVVQA